MGVRITQGLITERVLSDLAFQTRRLLDLERQLATGQKVNAPSDDPLAARRAINARTRIAANTQYVTNISTTGPFLREAETALLTVNDVLQRANELGLQGSSSSASAQRDTIALEVNQLLENLLNQGNLVSNGRHVFGGTRTLDPPFEATRDANGEITAVNYAGNNEDIEIAIADGVNVPINITGQAAFLPTFTGSVDVFQTLIDLRDSLRAGDGAGIETSLGSLDAAQDQVLIGVARIGAVQNRLESLDANLAEVNTQLQEVVSDNLDADFAEVIVNLNAQSNAYQAALNAAARVIQPSLLDFVG